MRVIGGEAKRKRLVSVSGEGTRPITDRVKESLFDILAPRVADSAVLDLFAGTGGVGIEALSRGARLAVFVDSDRRAIRAIRRNLDITGLADRAQVYQRDAFQFIRSWRGEPFDLVYVAPPQYHELWERALRELEGRPLLAPGCGVIAQIHPKEHRELALRSLALVDLRRYGSTTLCFYESSEV